MGWGEGNEAAEMICVEPAMARFPLTTEILKPWPKANRLSLAALYFERVLGPEIRFFNAPAHTSAKTFRDAIS